MKNLILLGEFLTLLFVTGVSHAAAITGISYILFPELAAISYGVLTKLQGTWARSHFLLIVTPTLTAIIGVLIAKIFPYSVYSVILSIFSALVIVRSLNSPIAPALAAGYLPVILGEGSWWYPLSVFVSIILLVIVLKFLLKTFPNYLPPLQDQSTSTAVQHTKQDWQGTVAFILFIFAALIVSYFSELRFILFPPLVVISFEMLTKPNHCPWTGRPIALFITSILVVGVGLLTKNYLDSATLGVSITMATGILTCRIYNLYLPPAMAIGLLPFVTEHPDVRLLYSVTIGLLLLTVFHSVHVRYFLK